MAHEVAAKMRVWLVLMLLLVLLLPCGGLGGGRRGLLGRVGAPGGGGKTRNLITRGAADGDSGAEIFEVRDYDADEQPPVSSQQASSVPTPAPSTAEVESTTSDPDIPATVSSIGSDPEEEKGRRKPRERRKRKARPARTPRRTPKPVRTPSRPTPKPDRRKPRLKRNKQDESDEDDAPPQAQEILRQRIVNDETDPAAPAVDDEEDEEEEAGSLSTDLSSSAPSSATTASEEEETDVPTDEPSTSSPTAEETDAPTDADTTSSPTAEETDTPTDTPTTSSPTVEETEAPTDAATTIAPTVEETEAPTDAATASAPEQEEVEDEVAPQVEGVESVGVGNTTSAPPEEVVVSEGGETITGLNSTSTTSVFDWIYAQPQLSSFASALSASVTGVDFALAEQGPGQLYTVFAANDRAFNALDDDYVTDLLPSDDYSLHLQSLVLNHLTAEAAFAEEDLVDGLEFSTLDGEPVRVIVNSTGSYLSTFANLWGLTDAITLSSGADQTLSNGVVHEVNTALVPVWYYVSLFDILSFLPDQFTTLTTLIQQAGMVDTISELEGSTFIAPSDAAFAEMPPELYQHLTSPEGADSLQQLINYHIIPSMVNYIEMDAGETSVPTLLEGEEITVQVGEGDFSLNGEPPSNLYLDRMNIQYEVGKVLIPQSLSGLYSALPTETPVEKSPKLDATLYEVVDSTSNLTTLGATLKQINASVALNSSSSGPFTLFAPTDDAFEAALGGEYLEQLLKPEFDLHLRNLALYHVVPGEELETQDLTDRLLLTMSNLMTARVLRTSSNVQLTTSSVSFGRVPEINITGDQVLAANGALHNVDYPLIPFWYFFDVPSSLSSMGSRFSTLSNFFEQTNLTETVADLVHATIVSPNNYVFDLLPSETSDILLGNSNLLESVLRYHIIPEVVPFTALDFGVHEFPTLLDGETLTITVARNETSGEKILTFNDIVPVGPGHFLARDNLFYESGLVLIPPSLSSVLVPLDEPYDTWPTAFDAGQMTTDSLYVEGSN